MNTSLLAHLTEFERPLPRRLCGWRELLRFYISAGGSPKLAGCHPQYDHKSLMA